MKIEASMSLIRKDLQQKNKIYSVLKNLEFLPKVSVDLVDGTRAILIAHPQEYFPNFKLVWCPGKKHYRVYIHVGATTHEKTNAGYCICTVGTGLAATGFCMLYSFLHKHRSNNKDSAA